MLKFLSRTFCGTLLASYPLAPMRVTVASVQSAGMGSGVGSGVGVGVGSGVGVGVGFGLGQGQGQFPFPGESPPSKYPPIMSFKFKLAYA